MPTRRRIIGSSRAVTSPPVRVGINGFGRIGRCVARLLDGTQGLELVAVNDLADKIENLAYLYNFDTVYGRPARRAKVVDMGTLDIDGQILTFTHEPDLFQVPWEDREVDILVESSGVRANVAAAQALVKAGRVKKVIITHLPDGDIDTCLIMGVNDHTYDPGKHHVVSSSICDANAIAHAVKLLDDTFGIVNGFITTLHPWLAYQKLVDSHVSSTAYPGMVWDDFSLGRSSVASLIPKNTTAVRALRPVLPHIEERIRGFSYRVPTQTVCSADLTIQLSRPVSTEEVTAAVSAYCAASPYAVVNGESLVSVDYSGEACSVAFDGQWTTANGDMVKMVLWYDNEWGYSSRVVDMIGLLARH